MTTAPAPPPPAELPISGAADLSERQQLACAARELAALGYNENFTGHITWQLPGTEDLLVNPWGRWWDEVTASQVCRVNLDGEVLEGEFVTEAIFIHTELHRARPDAAVVIHNHPYYGTLLSAIGELPRITHQAGCVFDDEMVLVDEYRGAVADAAEGRKLAAEIGDATGAVMVNHGVLVTGRNMAEAMFRAITFERMCRTTFDLLGLGREPRQIEPRYRAEVKGWLRDNGAEAYWDGAVRQLVQAHPEVVA